MASFQLWHLTHGTRRIICISMNTNGLREMKNKKLFLISASLIVSGMLIQQGFTDPELYEDAVPSCASKNQSAYEEFVVPTKSLGQDDDMASFVVLDDLKKPTTSLTDKEESGTSVAKAGETLIEKFTLQDAQLNARLASAAYLTPSQEENATKSQAIQNKVDTVTEMRKLGYAVYAFQNANAKGDETDHAGYVYIKGNEVIVTFRGTEHMNDFIGDANAPMMPNDYGQGHLHSGFKNRFMDLRANVDQVIRDHYRGQRDVNLSNLDYKVAGHSLGGALATIYVDYLMNKGGVSPDRILLTTYGSPRVGDGIFADDFNKKMGANALRVFAGGDPVPGVGPKEAGYTHVGTAYATKTGEYLFNAHYMETSYIRSLSQLTQQKLYTSKAYRDEVGYVRYAANRVASGFASAIVYGMTMIANSPMNYGKRSDQLSDIDTPQVQHFLESTDLTAILKQLSLIESEILDAKRRNDEDNILQLKNSKSLALSALSLSMENIDTNPELSKNMPKQLKGTFDNLKKPYRDYKAAFEKAQDIAHGHNRILDELNKAEVGSRQHQKLKAEFEASRKKLESQQRKVNREAKAFYKTIEKSMHKHSKKS